MRQFFGFSKTQTTTLIVLGMIALIGGAYTLIRDYHIRPSVSSHAIDQTTFESFQPLFVLDINRSPADSMELVPGIGPALAMRIVDYRTDHGPFEAVDSLLAVAGIGRKTLEKIRPYFTVTR